MEIIGAVEISIHAPRVGGDAYLGVPDWDIKKFQSTPPVWGATDDLYPERYKLKISIHAPRVGGDEPTYAQLKEAGVISIHAPRVGGDPGPRS